MTSALDLACFSYVADAHVLTVERYPQPNGGAEVTDIIHSVAGDGPLVAAGAAALGLRTGLAGNHVGVDPAGQAVLDYLQHHGVRHTIRASASLRTPTVTVISDQDGNRVWLAWLSHARHTLQDADTALLTQGAMAYIDCYPVIEPAALRALDTTTGTGIPLFLNLGGCQLSQPITAAVTDQPVAVVQTNLEEHRHHHAEALANHLYQRLHPDVAIVTLGRLGAIARTTTGLASAPANLVPVHHTHGAGAAFSAGFAHAYLKGRSPTDALRLACTIASGHCASASPPASRRAGSPAAHAAIA
jgi:sugar/nucleoside kinase (ribokinase family)